MAKHHALNHFRDTGVTDAYSRGEFIAACIRTYGFISGVYVECDDGFYYVSSPLSNSMIGRSSEPSLQATETRRKKGRLLKTDDEGH